MSIKTGDMVVHPYSHVRLRDCEMGQPQCARCGAYEQLGTMHICPDMRATRIRTGDIVLHRPTGEKWMVAYVEGDFLAWRGWPEGEARLSDCELVEACTDATHWKWVKHIAESASGWRALKCQAMLQERYAAFIEPDITDQRRPCPHCGAPMEASVPARDAEPTPEMKAR